MILQSNNGSSEILMEGDLIVPNTRNAMKCWNNQCLWKKSSNGLVEVPYTLSNEFPYYQKKKIEKAMKTYKAETCFLTQWNGHYNSHTPKPTYWTEEKHVQGGHSEDQQAVQLLREKLEDLRFLTARVEC